MEISEVMTPNPVALRTDETVDLAARLLERSNIGALPVCNEKGTPVGMLTDRDLVTRCMAVGGDPRNTTAGTIMSKWVVSVEKTASVEEALDLMGTHQVRRIPVTEQGRLAGIVSLGDLIRSRIPDTPVALRQISDNIRRI